jgi:hypothetical protein
MLGQSRRQLGSPVASYQPGSGTRVCGHALVLVGDVFALWPPLRDELAPHWNRALLHLTRHDLGDAHRFQVDLRCHAQRREVIHYDAGFPHIVQDLNIDPGAARVGEDLEALLRVRQPARSNTQLTRVLETTRCSSSAVASTDGVESRVMADAQAPRRHYRSIVADSRRWDGFAFRPGDIVISTPEKSGTTWTQMLCALLIFDGPAFPAPLDEVSPWLDRCSRPLAEVTAALATQTHRRFIKTHTPLDGLPLHPDATYLVVGRDPRDVMISYEHHAVNMDFAHFLALRAAAVGNEDLAELPERRVLAADPVERFRRFVADETHGGPPTLVEVLQHLDTGWQRRHDANVALFHYADLKSDLAGELLRLARVLGIPCSPQRARELAPEASLARMRERAADVAPNALQGTLKDVRAFFRSGGSGEWRERLSTADPAAYEARVAELVAPNLAAWAHGGRLASGVDPER